MKVRPVRLLFRFSIFVIALLIFTGVVAWLMLGVGPENLGSVKTRIDNIWLATSIIRCCILALIIYFLPRIYLSKNRKHSVEADKLIEQLKSEDAQNTITFYDGDIGQLIYNHQKMASSYEKMYKYRYRIALFLISIELIAVQLPHWL